MASPLPRLNSPAIEFPVIEFTAAGILAMTVPEDAKDYRVGVLCRRQLKTLVEECMSPS